MLPDESAKLGWVVDVDHFKVFHHRRLQPAQQIDAAAIQRAVELGGRQGVFRAVTLSSKDACQSTWDP